MTTVLYIDVLFFENFILDLFVLWVTAFILNRKFKIFRSISASAIGAFYVCTLYIYQADFLDILIVKLSVIAVMLFISFKIYSAREFFKLFIVFITVNFIFAGGIYFAQNMILNKSHEKISIVSIFMGVILLISFGKEIFTMFLKGILKKDLSSDMILYYNGKIIHLKTYTDTGNLLVDPISKCPVIIACKSKIKKIADCDNVLKLKNLRLVPCRTVSEKYEILYGFKPDKIIYNDKEINAVVAISKEEILSEDYEAIINPMTLI